MRKKKQRKKTRKTRASSTKKHLKKGVLGEQKTQTLQTCKKLAFLSLYNKRNPETKNNLKKEQNQ